MRWSVGLMGSPDWEGRFFKGEKNKSYDGLGPGTDSGQNKVLADLLKDNEHSGFSFTAGIHVLYDINRRWFCRLGIYYSDKKIYADNFITTIYGLRGFYRVPSAKTSPGFPFLEIPLTFHYILTKPFGNDKAGTCYTSYTLNDSKKPLFYVFAGPAFSVNLNQHLIPSRTFTPLGDTTYKNTLPVYVDKFTLHFFGFYAGIGMMKYFNEHLFLTLEPVIRFFPLRWYSKKFRQDEGTLVPYPKAVIYHVKDLPWSAGLQVSLNYHF